MSLKVVLPNGEVEVVTKATRWQRVSGEPGFGSLFLYGEDGEEPVAEFADWWGVKKE